MGDMDDLPLDYLTLEEVSILNEKFHMTRAQRVRAAMFPETVTNTKKPPPPFELPVLDPSKPMTALQTLAEPSQELKNAIADIINYQVDADFAQKFVPEIIKLLADPDGDVVRNAAELTADLSKSEAACAVMTGNDALTTALLRAAAAADGPTLEASKTRAAVAGTLLNYSEYERGRASIFRSGGIALLVRLLGSPAERVVNYAITTLHNLVQYQEGAKVAVRTAGGIQKMVPLLRWKDSKFLTININCLHMLAFGDPEAKIAIWNSRGPKELVAILKKTNDQKLLWTASRLVKVLSTSDNNKESLVESGCFIVLVQRLQTTSDPKLTHNYLTTLRNLSDAEGETYADDSHVGYILQLLNQPNEDVVMFAAGIIGNLSSEKPRLKSSIFSLGGVEVVLQTMLHAKREDIIDPLMCTLRHLTSQIGLNDRVQTQIRDLGGIEMSIQILKRTRCWPIVKAGCGLVRNLAHHYENHEILVDLNIIPRLGEIVVLALKENRKRAKKEKEDLLEKSRKDRLGLVRNDSNASSSSAGFTPVQVDMGDIIEDALGTLAILAESDPNKDPIQDTGVVDLVKDMILRSEVAPQSENVMTVAQALLALYPEEMQEVTEKKRSSMRLNTMGRRPGSHGGSQTTFEDKFETVVHSQIADNSQYGGLRVLKPGGPEASSPKRHSSTRSWKESEEL